MLNNPPLVSIITPVFNSEKYLRLTMESVLNQTYQNWEMILADDCSTDSSYSIAQEFALKDKRFISLRLPKNSGTATARNAALELAAGKYIAFIDSDDLWLPAKLEKQLLFMKENSLVFTFCSYFVIDENGKRNASFGVPEKISYKDLLYTNCVGNLTAIYDAEFYGKVNLTAIRYEDYVLWLSLLKKVKYTLGQTLYLAEYRKYSSSYSSNKLKTIGWQWNIYRKIEKFGFIKSLYYLFFYSFYGVMKYRKLKS